MIGTAASIDRREQRRIDPETYENFVEAVFRIPAIRTGEVSVLVHGSYAKQDLVSGWSDIDLIVLHRDPKHRLLVEPYLNAYANACDLLVRPVHAKFDSIAGERAVDGLPKAALVDALASGFFVSGFEEISKIGPEEVDLSRVCEEARLRTNRALEHWVTRIRPHFRVNPSLFVLDSAKVALQLLMYKETSLWSRDRTRSGYLTSYKERSDENVELFEEALLVRSYWYEYTKGHRMYAAQDLFFCWMMLLLEASRSGDRVL